MVCVVQILFEDNGRRSVEVLIDGVSEVVLGPFSESDAAALAAELAIVVRRGAAGRLQ